MTVKCAVLPGSQMPIECLAKWRIYQLLRKKKNKSQNKPDYIKSIGEENIV